MEPCEQFLSRLMDKLWSQGTVVKLEDNIVIGETLDLMNKPDSGFPRMELLIEKLKFDGYIDQGIHAQSFRFSVGAHFRRKNMDVVPEDMFTALRWGREIKAIVASFHNDRAQGILPCEGFVQLDGYPEITFEHELFPKITSVIFFGEANIELNDTYQSQ